MTEQKANYTLTIEADSGYMSTTDGRCTADQYGQAIAALHGEAPQRTWVGLTHEKRVSIICEDENRSLLEHCERIEQVLKEDNGA